MIWLRELFTAHQMGLALLHGQAFFVLGLSIFFLARRGSRLDVARSLVPLAAFGFCEAFVGWCCAWLGPAAALTPLLSWLRLLFLGIGYAFLLVFASLIHVSQERRQWRHWAFVVGLFALWLIGLAIACLVGVPEEQVWLGGALAAR